MWLNGCSGGETGRILNCGRNAVIGKVHRLGLVRSPQAKAQENKVNRARAFAARARREALGSDYKPRRPPPAKKPLYAIHSNLASIKPPTPVAEVRVFAECLLVTIEDLNDSMCRWPIGNPKTDEFRYCGLPTRGSYCRFHGGLAYVEVADRKRKDQYLMRLT